MKPERADRFDASELDDVVHGRVRLGIMAYLAGAGAADFVTLQEHLRTTNGNLSVHLSKLEEAGYVTLERAIVGKRSRTTVHPTREGQTALRAYVQRMARLVEELG
ncbi:MAG TPA: transcriptional regulator [Croceibacterium sp.]